MHSFDSSEVISMKLTIEVLTEVAENLENQAVSVRSTVGFLNGVLQSLHQEEDHLTDSTLKTINEHLEPLRDDSRNILHNESVKKLDECFKINKT